MMRSHIVTLLVLTQSCCIMPSSAAVAVAAAAAVPEKSVMVLRGHQDNRPLLQDARDHAGGAAIRDKHNSIGAAFKNKAPTAAPTPPATICEFTRNFTDPEGGGVVTLRFPNLPDAAGEVTIDLEINGDFGDAGQRVILLDEESDEILEIGATGMDCVLNNDSVPATAAEFNVWNSNDEVTFDAIVDGGVNSTICPAENNFVRITLIYPIGPEDSCAP
jgi:hypothetical protein